MNFYQIRKHFIEFFHTFHELFQIYEFFFQILRPFFDEIVPIHNFIFNNEPLRVHDFFQIDDFFSNL